MFGKRQDDGAYLQLVRLAERELALETSRDPRVIAERLVQREQRERREQPSNARRSATDFLRREVRLATIGG